ncbi:gamma-tubulin complex component 2 [Iris pallida]|uniref:Gamma-tubulin complex component 2 n=1 Tax=Iris pallida TaxID=29817 RepID=A0AAX6E849_IRIPA|nr:gamma-tubulin complex component 2 [Iris pallida]
MSIQITHSNSCKLPGQSNLPKTYFLKDFKRKHIAFGRLNSDIPSKEDVYSIIVDQIFACNAYLFKGDRKFEDIILGDLINWPKERFQIIRI